MSIKASSNTSFQSQKQSMHNPTSTQATSVSMSTKF